MNRTLLFAGIIAATTSLSGCGWYMRQADSIGSYMPTYEGWFGDGERSEVTPQPQAQQPQVSPYYNNNYSNSIPQQQPLERRMPISGNPAGSYAPQPQAQPVPQGYTATAPQGYPPFPPPPHGGFPPPPPPMGAYPPPPPPHGGNLPSAGSFAPPEGFSASDANTDTVAPPPAPGFGNAAPSQDGPDPMAGLKNLQMQQQQGQQPLIPFTEPVLENQSVEVDNFSETITEETPKESTIFSDIADTISGWFTSSDAPKKEFPNLASVPENPEYNTKMEAAVASKQELEADKEAAQEQQKAITDWSDLAEENTEDNSVTSLSSITSPTGNETVVERDAAPEEVVMPEPKIQVDAKAPETMVIMQKPQPMPEPQPMPKMKEAPAIAAPVAEEAPAPTAPIVIADEQPPVETKPVFLRKPTLPSGVQLLPRNRYSDRY